MPFGESLCLDGQPKESELPNKESRRRKLRESALLAFDFFVVCFNTRPVASDTKKPTKHPRDLVTVGGAGGRILGSLSSGVARRQIVATTRALLGVTQYSIEEMAGWLAGSLNPS